MRVLLTALNAKFIHSSLALRCLKAYASGLKADLILAEYTINQDSDEILADLYNQKPDIVCFSCYLWNIGQILIIAENLKKILPQIQIVLGGPEVSYDSSDILMKHPVIDFIIRGEGEKTFFELVQYFTEHKKRLEEIPGISYRKKSEILENPSREPLSLEEIPFVYDDLQLLENKIIYYETQRGCPYQCQYCLSSLEQGVRFLPKKRVASDLQFFLNHQVKQVKFVDRTFNCNREHAHFIWSYLMEHDNGITNFHMEITADLLDEETLDFLSKARPGLFQFEIGVQSTNPDTIKAIRRNTHFSLLSQRVQKIKQMGNIHQHLDLIAGLPLEDYASFQKSFNDVYALHPEQLQLGFLKLLKGSGLRRDASRFGIVSRNNAPYEVLFTKELSYAELLRLKAIEDMVETYYNSGKALHTISYLLQFFSSPFAFYEALADYWHENHHHKVQHSKIELFFLLYQFCLSVPALQDKQEFLQTVLKFDLYLGDNIKSPPEWIGTEDQEKEKKRAFFENREMVQTLLPHLQSYSPRQISRMCHIAIFSYHPLHLAQGNQEIYPQKTAVLFDYTQKQAFHSGAVFFILESFPEIHSKTTKEESP